MKEIYSRLNPNKLLHRINHLNTNISNKILTENKDFIRVESAIINNEDIHLHYPNQNYARYDFLMTQECWIVLSGSVKITLYDLNDTILHQDILNSWDYSITFQGGHEFITLEEDTIIQEYKNGPYKGSIMDLEYF